MGQNKSERKPAGEILIVDDAAINLKLLIRILAESHYQVRSAKNGREALKTVAEKVPDLILLDVLMPEMDGFEVCRRLKAQAYSRDIPVIFVSALNDVVDKTKGFQLGAVDYITKPFESAEVLARVQTHLTIRSHQMKLEAVNRQLRSAENELRRMNAELEERVRRRSVALEKANLGIRRSEERFREFVEGTDNLIARIDARGHLVYVNNAAHKVFGMPPEECIGLSLFSFVEARDRERTEDWFSVCARDRVTSATIENRLVSRAGDRHDLIWTVNFHYHDQGHLDHVNLIARDITERKCEEMVRACFWRLLEYAADHSVMELLTKFLDEVEDLTDSEIGFYHFLEEDQEMLSLQAWSTNTLENMCTAEGAGLHYPISQAGVWVDCVRERRSIIHNDYASLAHKKGLPEGHAPLIRELVVPVFRRDKIVAILGVANKATDYTEEDMKTVEQLADFAWETVVRRQAEEEVRRQSVQLQATNARLQKKIDEHMAAENQITAYQKKLRALVSQLTISEEKERKRLACQLHDSLGQSLILMKMRVDSLLSDSVSESMRTFMTETQASLTELIEETQDLTRNLGTPILQKLGFKAAVEEWLKSEVEKKHGIITKVIDRGFPENLSSEATALLFRAVRELAINVIKHAQAQNLEIMLDAREDHLSICVSDDGVGLTHLPGEEMKGLKGGYGLFSIEERVSYMGGSLETESQSGQGTRVTLHVPRKSTIN